MFCFEDVLTMRVFHMECPLIVYLCHKRHHSFPAKGITSPWSDMANKACASKKTSSYGTDFHYLYQEPYQKKALVLKKCVYLHPISGTSHAGRCKKAFVLVQSLESPILTGGLMILMPFGVPYVLACMSLHNGGIG